MDDKRQWADALLRQTMGGPIGASVQAVKADVDTKPVLAHLTDEMRTHLTYAHHQVDQIEGFLERFEGPIPPRESKNATGMAPSPGRLGELVDLNHAGRTLCERLTALNDRLSRLA